MPRWYLAIHAAFWWARWNVTSEYGHRGLEPLLPWLHSARGRADFRTESQAFLQACELAMHLGTCIPAPCQPDQARHASRPHLRTSFAPNITLRGIFLDEATCQDWTLPIDALSDWEAKPWRLDLSHEPDANGLEFDEDVLGLSPRQAMTSLGRWIDLLSLREAVLISPDPPEGNRHQFQDKFVPQGVQPLQTMRHFPAHQHEPELVTRCYMHQAHEGFRRPQQFEAWLPGFPQEGRPTLEDMPAWTQQLWQGIFQQQAEIEFQDEGPVLYLLTWYLHPNDHPMCKSSRVAKLDLYFEHWEDDLRRLWSDEIHVNTNLEAFIVFPEPPRTTGAMHSGHLIVAQEATTPCVLISTFEDNAMENHLTQVAVVAPRWVNKHVIQQLSQVPSHVLRDGHECWLDETWIDDDGPGVQLHDGSHVLQYIKHAGAGPRHTWQHQRPMIEEDDSDVASLMIATQRGASPQVPLSVDIKAASSKMDTTPTGESRCGDLLSLSEAVLNSPAQPDWDAAPNDGSCNLPLPMSSTGSVLPPQGPHLPQPGANYHGWTLEMWEIFNIHASLIDEGEDERLRIRSWYLHHDLAPRCDEPRHLRLGAELTEWQNELETLWRDRIQVTQMPHIQIVRPTARVNADPDQQSPAHVDVILSQPLPHPQRSILVDYTTDDGMRIHIHTFAVSVTDPIPRPSFLRSIAPRRNWLRPHIISAGGRHHHDGLLRFRDGDGVRAQPEADDQALYLLQVASSLEPSSTFQNHVQCQPMSSSQDSTQQNLAPCSNKLSHPHGLPDLQQCGARCMNLDFPEEHQKPVDIVSLWSQQQPPQIDEEFAIMQLGTGTPCSLKDTPDQPSWFSTMQSQLQPPEEQHQVPHHDEESEYQPSSHDYEEPEDPGTPGDSGGSEPPSPHSQQEEVHRQSVLLFLCGQAPIHAYIAWHNHDAMMQEIANHCLVPVHRIYRLHDLAYLPEDIRDNKDVYPMIVQRELDVEPGSMEQLCLIDIELFAQRHEPHYFTGPKVNRAVWHIPHQVVRRTLLRIVGQDNHCIRAAQRCIVKMNGDIWNVQDARPRRIHHGDHFCIQIPPIEDCPHADILRAWTGDVAHAEEHASPEYSPSSGQASPPSSFDLERLLESDDASLFQSQMCTLQGALCSAHQKVIGDGRSPVTPNRDSSESLTATDCLQDDHHPSEAAVGPPFWVQSLQSSFQTAIQVQETSNDADVYIQTWYLSHHNHLRCDPGRPLKLAPDPIRWQEEAKALWTDLIDDSSPCWFELVTPQPLPVGSSAYIAHLMISQHRDDTVLLADRRVETVVTVIYEHAERSKLKQLALVMPAWSLADDFFHVLCISQQCIQRRSRGRPCFINHGPNVLELGLRDLFHHADSLTVHVPEAPTRTTEGPYLLQRHVQTQPQTTAVESSEPVITADFQKVISLRDEISHIELPIFQWNQLELDVELCNFVDSLPHWNGQHIQRIEFYTDGSFETGSRVGAAVIAIAHSQDEKFLLGALAQTMYGDHAYTGELCAIVWALVWACQLTHILPATILDQLEFAFFFDCMAAGYQASGWWRGKLHQDWHAILRSLMQYLEHRMSPSRIWSQHVYAHTGLLPNELVDRIAKYASSLTHINQPIPWLTWFEKDNLTALQWIWALDKLNARDPTMPVLKGNTLRIPLRSQDTQVSAGHDGHQTQSVDLGKDQRFTLRLATANVMTLLDTDSSASNLTGGRQLYLMQQFHEASCHIVAIQETRHRRLSQNNEWYHVVGHKATPNGQAGIQVWVAKKQRFGSATISLQQILVVFSDENTLILKIKLPGKTFVVIAGHAPHSSRPHAESVNFWKTITAHVNRACRGLPLFFLGDTNAHVGSAVSAAIGSHGAVQENGPGQTFHDWMLTHQLFAPATFEQHHTGSHATFSSIRGQHGHRLDYVGLPLEWFNSHAITWTSDTIDLGLARDDHYAVCVDVPFTVRQQHQVKQRGQRTIDAVHAAHWATSWEGQSMLQTCLTSPSWDTSVHEQAALLSQQVHQAIPSSLHKQKQSFRKRHLLPQTQALIRTKQDLFKRLKFLQASERQLYLQVVFLTWKSDRQSSRSPSRTMTWEQTEKQLDVQIACVTHEYQAVAPLVQQAVRKDDATFLQNLAIQAGSTHSQEGLQGLWKQIQHILPKNKAKRDRQQVDLDQAMLRHFSELEAGKTITWDQLLQRCLQRNQETNLERQSLDIQLDELPSLWQTEQLCLKQKAGKCPGLDHIPGELCSHGATAIAPALHNLLMKVVAQGAEPLEFKGGRLCTIYKGKGSKLEPSKYRGILLADVFAKIFHSWTRTQLLPTFQQRARPGQLGGRPSQQTATATHLLRLHAWNGRQLHLTTGVLFIDVRAAFHHMLRDLVFGIRDPMSAAELSTFLDPNHHDIPAIAEGIRQAVHDGSHDIKPLLQFILADIHQQTWFQMTTSDNDRCYVETSRGTRPGSPLADVGFNLLFAKVMAKVEEGLHSIQNYDSGMTAAGLEFYPIAWMDDLAIPLTAEDAGQMPKLMTDVLSLVHDVFTSFGLTVNMDQGKTEAVLMFRGQGADAQRLRLFDQPAVPTLIASTETHVLSLRVASSYKHLGARYTMDSDIEFEVNARLGAARSAFHELKKPVFLNRHIAVPGRIQLLHSLIFSRLLYGCATRADMPQACLKRVESQIMKLYRSVIDNGFWKDETLRSDGSLRAEFELPTFRLLWAKTRLVYFQHFAGLSTGIYKEAVLQEYQRGRGWLFEVEADLTWMHELVDLPFAWPPSQPIDWPVIFDHVATSTTWKKLVRKAFWRHLKRESVAWQTEDLQLSILRELEGQGLHLDPDDNLPPPREFPCDLCDRVFDAPQKLAVHKLKSHQIESDERAFIQSTVCPGCLTDHWTTRRLQQHLRHRANGCYDRLYGVRPAEPTVHITLPDHLKGVKRLPARRIHYGPLRPTKETRTHRELMSAISHCYDLGLSNGAWLRPADHSILHARLCLHFRSCWERACQSQEFDALLEQCVDIPSHLESTDAIVACSLDAWGHDLLLTLDEDAPGSSCLQELLHDLGTTPTRQQEASLRQQLDDLLNPEPAPAVPQEAVQRPRDHRHPLVNGFAQAMLREEARLRQHGRFDPGPRPHPKTQFGLVVHLYSGRRRRGDFQHWAEHFAAAKNISICVISIDTAIDPAMNVHDNHLWSTLIQAGREGYILGLLLGPPCETWSSARFHRLEDGTGPRPLRSRARPWGLDRLRFPELEQLGVGSDLFLRGLWLCILVAFAHGAVILEHPALPADPGHPSIWATWVVHLLRTYCPWFQLLEFQQWKLGAAAIKPTGLLFANCSLPEWIHANELPHRLPPQAPLIGRDATGSFKTARAKEYPSAMNRALAQAIIASKEHVQTSDPAPAWWPFVQTLQASCSCFESGHMMPDYQPKKR